VLDRFGCQAVPCGLLVPAQHPCLSWWAVKHNLHGGCL
jgi:hypothetical protein